MRTYICNVTARRRARTLIRAVPFYRFAPVTAENFLQLRRKPVARTFSQRGDKIRGRLAALVFIKHTYMAYRICRRPEEINLRVA